MKKKPFEHLSYYLLSARTFFACAVLALFYEVTPNLLCELGGGRFVHFAGIVQCNSIFENVYLALLFLFIISGYVFFSRKSRYELKYLVDKKGIKINKFVFKVSFVVVLFAVSYLWVLTGFSVVPDSGARSALVMLYHATMGSPVVTPFIYASIVSAAMLAVLTGNYKYYFSALAVIAFGCYITMSRGFLLSALMPLILISKPSKIIFLAPVFVVVFFLRDALNGTLIGYLDSGGTIMPILIDSLGEFANTYFGRRYSLDLSLSTPYAEFIFENLTKASGIYYFLLPIFKMLALLNINMPSATLAMNDNIEKNLSITGFAGSALSDFVFYPVASLAILLFDLVIIVRFLRSASQPMGKLFFVFLFAVLLPNAFRWSFVGFYSSMSGISVVLIFLFRNKRRTQVVVQPNQNTSLGARA